MFRSMMRLVLAFLLLWPAWAWAQMESTPGAGPGPGHSFVYSGTNSVIGRYAEVPCVVNGTSGTLTLNLGSCPGASSDVFHIGPLTGATTIVFTNPVPGQTVRLEIAANTQTVTLPACVGPVPVAVSGNSFIVYDVFDTAPTYWCPAGVQASLTPPASFSIAHSGATACATGTTCVAGSITYDNTSQVGYVATGYCDTGASSCSGGSTQGVTVSSVTQTSGSATSTCTRTTGIAGITDATDHLTQDAFKCIATVAGTAVYTITYSASAHLPEALVAIINSVTTTSPDDGIGKSAANTPSAAAPAVTTTVTTNQANEFLISAVFTVGGGSAPTVGAGYTSIVSDNTGVSALLQWNVSGASGSTQSASAVASAATGSVISVAGLKHP